MNSNKFLTYSSKNCFNKIFLFFRTETVCVELKVWIPMDTIIDIMKRHIDSCVQRSVLATGYIWISKVYLGSCVQLYSLAETPQLPPSPRIWAPIRGRYWSAKIDAIFFFVTPW
jgi:hypothetical protein